MTSAFRRVKDNNNKTGRQRKTCPFERELQALLGDRPIVEPVCLVASLPMTNEPGAGTSAGTSAENPDGGSPTAPPREKRSREDSASGESPKGLPRKKREREREDRLLAWLEATETRLEASRDKRLEKKLKAITELALRCHQEKMEMAEKYLAKKN